VYVDFCKAAVTASGVVAIVGRPIGSGRPGDKMLGKNVDGGGNRGIELLIGKCQREPATAKRNERHRSEAKMHVEPDQLANCNFHSFGVRDTCSRRLCSGWSLFRREQVIIPRARN